MKKNRTIQLPKGYMSYSQLALWLADRNRYGQLYFDGRDELRGSNIAMEYGKVVADALENGIQTGDLLTDSAMLLLPKYDIADQEVRTTLRAGGFEVPILIKPDSMDSHSKDFLEYKTGKTPWTQKKAQNHLQLRFYAMGIYLEYHKLIRNTKLIWIETDTHIITDPKTGIVTKEVKPTGNVKEFPVHFSLTDITNTMAMVLKAAKEIETAWAVHTPDPKLAW